MKKRKQKRFINSQQIQEEIRKYNLKMKKTVEQAKAIEDEAEEIYQRDHDGRNKELIGFKREQAKKLWRYAYRIEEKKIPHLIQKLAEIKTPNLPGLGITDESTNA